MNKDKLQQIIKDIKDICDSDLTNVDDSSILEESVKIYNTEIIQDNKTFKSADKIDDKPSEKQIAILKQRGINYEGLNRKEVSAIIQDIFKGDNNATHKNS